MKALSILLLLAACGPDPSPPTPTPSVPPPAPAQGALTPAAAGNPDDTSGREMADIAFNLAMQAYETGQPDAAGAVSQAIAAHQMAGSLDTDGIFHLAVLQEAAGDHGQAIFSAERILAERPTHLLALGIAGRAAASSGDRETARGYYQRLLSAYATEQGAGSEYGHHSRLLPIYQEEADRFMTQ